MFPYIGNVIIPTDELHDFSEGRLKPPTSVSQQMAEVFLNLLSCFFGVSEVLEPDDFFSQSVEMTGRSSLAEDF